MNKNENTDLADKALKVIMIVMILILKDDDDYVGGCDEDDDDNDLSSETKSLSSPYG